MRHIPEHPIQMPRWDRGDSDLSELPPEHRVRMQDAERDAFPLHVLYQFLFGGCRCSRQDYAFHLPGLQVSTHHIRREMVHMGMRDQQMIDILEASTAGKHMRPSVWAGTAEEKAALGQYLSERGMHPDQMPASQR